MTNRMSSAEFLNSPNDVTSLTPELLNYGPLIEISKVPKITQRSFVEEATIEDQIKAMARADTAKTDFAMMIAKEKGELSPDQEKEVAIYRGPMFSEILILLDLARDRGYEGDYFQFLDDFENKNFEKLHIDPKDFYGYFSSVPDALKKDFDKVSMQEASEAIYDGIAGIFKKDYS